MLKSVHYAPFLQQSVQQQIVLSIRSLCSLPTTVCVTVSNIVHQVAVLPSFTVNLHYCTSGRYMSRTCRAGAELLRSGRELTTKVGEQPWPQLMRCTSIYCHVCGCVFQEDGIVARSLREEWYRLIEVRIEQGEDVNDFNLRTKELGCNYWSTYTKSGIGGVQVTSLHRDPIGVDNRSLGAKN